MTYLRITFGMAIMALATFNVQADAECEKDCFETQRSCSAKTEFLLGQQDCSEEQVACRLGCNSGKPMKAYRDLGGLNYSLRPLTDHIG